MATNQTKYRLEELVGSLPRSFDFTQTLKGAGIPYRTFFRDKTIPLKSKSKIGGDRLRKYASLFGVSMEELYTPTKQSTSKKLKTALS